MKKGIGLFLAVIMIVTILGACAPKKDESEVVDLNEIHSAVKESLGEDGYFPNREMTIEELEDLMGLNQSDIESYVGEGPMMSVSIDTFLAIKAKEGKADAVEASLQEYRTFLVEDSMQYPMNLAKVNASKVVRYGDYVFFLMLGGVDPNMDNEDTTDEDRLEFAKGEIQKVEEAINKFFK